MADSEILKFPGDLVDLVLREWGPREPSPEVVQRFLDTVFYASLKAEEGRQVTFQATLTEEVGLNGLSTEAGLAWLGTPVPFDVEALRKLSPIGGALPLIVAEADGELAIVGLAGHGTTNSFETLLVQVYGPGVLALAIRGRYVASLAGGVIKDFTGPALQQPNAQSVWNEAFEDTHERLKTAVADRVADEYPEFQEDWARIAESTASNGLFPLTRLTDDLLRSFGSEHGGTLVIVEKGGGWQPMMDITYALSGLDVWEALIHACLQMLPITDLDLPGTVVDAGPHRLDRLIPAILALAGVDGAVVLSQEFEPMGFGARITVTDPAEVDVAHRDRYGEVDLRPRWSDFGTRHQSAFRLAAADPSATVLVASADRMSRVVDGSGGSVTAWHWQ